MNPRQMILSFVILSLLLLTGCEQATSPLNGTADDPGAFSFDKALIEGNYIVVLAHAAPLDRGLSYEQSSSSRCC